MASELQISRATAATQIAEEINIASNNASTAYRNGGARVQTDGTISQSERMFTARPRYAPKSSNKDAIYQQAQAARGQHAYIKLLTDAKQAASYVATKDARNTKGLTGPGSLVGGMVSTDPAQGYDKFILTGVSCTLSEKLQVTEVFGDGEVAYYFGRQPIMVNLSGVLIDSPDNSWFTDWLRMYSGFLRGSQLAKNYELLRLVLPNMILVGSITGISWNQDASNDVSVPFTFQFLAKTMEPVPATTMAPDKAAMLNYIDFSKSSTFVSQQSINSFKKKAAELTSAVQDPNTTIAQLGMSLSNYGSGLSTYLNEIDRSVKDFVSNNSFSQGLDSYTKMFQTTSANLNGMRLSIVSPIYGVLTSLTRLVTKTFGDVNKIFNSVFSPVQNVLRDIKNISDRAVALVNAVNNGVRGVGRNINRQIATTKNDFESAKKSLGKAAGSIATSPKTILQSISEMFKGGAIGGNAAFLQNKPRASISQSVGGAGVASLGLGYNSKIAMLTSTPVYSSKKGASL